jgi:OOP family OmpA-OmpF porin
MKKREEMFRKTFFRMLIPCVAFALLMGCATQKASPVVKAVDLNQKMASSQLVQKVDAFAVITDSSLSMNETYKNSTKLNQQKALVASFNETIPDLRMIVAAREFGQFAAFQGATSRPLFGAVNYTKSVLPQALAPKTSGFGFSPMDAAIDGVSSDLKSQTGQMAVIAFSDGEDMNAFAPVAAAKRMKSAYGDRVCIYTVQLGDHPDGAKLLKEVADAGQCGFMTTGEKVSSPQGMADFVEKVFLEAKRPAPVAAPVQEMKKAPEAQTAMEKDIVEKGRATLLVEFDFNKAVVKPKYYKPIEELSDVMKKHPDLNIVVEGHTDSVGDAKYNKKLSQKRAEAIKAVMVKKFQIDEKRVVPKGYGEDKPIASNKTKEGRQKNRRVEAAVDYIIQK